MNIFKETYSWHCDPFLIEASAWENDISKWPPVDFGSIYTFLIDKVGVYTKESLKAYKSLNAYNYYIKYDYDY